MKQVLAIALLVLAAACSNLPTEGDGIVALQVTIPASLQLREGESIQLEARALNQAGEVVSAPIRWQTPDEGIVVDEETGLVTGAASTGSARVQAVLGTLHSDLLTFTLLPAPTQGP